MALVQSIYCRILHGRYATYSITHSFFHSRLKTLPFLQILPTAAFPFPLRTDCMDSPDCLLLLLSISVFKYSFTLFSCWFREIV